MSTSISASMPAGRAENTAMRSAKKIASLIACVTGTAVQKHLPVRFRLAAVAGLRARVKPSSAPMARPAIGAPALGRPVDSLLLRRR